VDAYALELAFFVDTLPLNFDICTYILFFCSRFRDHSGDLDTFELSNAVAELWGHAPTMAQLSAMVHEVGAHETHKLSLEQFSDIFTRDWAISADEPSEPVLVDNEAKVGDMFEEEFGEGSLGFGVLLDELNCRIVVSTTNSKLNGKVHVGDGVLAVNGVPLGRAFHPGILQLRLKPLRRPLVLTFVRLGASAVEGLFDKPAEAEPAKAITTPVGTASLSAALIEEVFYRFDTDSSGDLDTFELSNAVAELWGYPPNTAQVTAMVHDTGAVETNTLTLQQFTDVLAKDWSSLSDDDNAAPKVTGRDAKPGDVFECAFPHAVLGFGVYYDEPKSRILVSLVSDAHTGVLEVGDIVLAVNGAPLGKVNRPSALQEAIKPLTRPLNITFMRRELPAPGAQNDEDLAAAKASLCPNEYNSAMIADVFRRFDWDASGDLDTFELSSAVAELWGHAPTTAQVAAMVRWVGAHESNSVTLPQFEVMLTQDWSNDSHQIESLSGGESAISGTLYEESFGAGPLGFGVIWDADKSRIVVSLLSTELMGKIEIGDGILAINGAPLGKVNSPLALAEAIKTLRRPLTITFVRHDDEDETADDSVPSSTTGFKLLRQMSQEASMREEETKESNATDTMDNTPHAPRIEIAGPSLEGAKEVSAAPHATLEDTTWTLAKDESVSASSDEKITLPAGSDEAPPVSIVDAVVGDEVSTSDTGEVGPEIGVSTEAPAVVVNEPIEKTATLEENVSPEEASSAVDLSPVANEGLTAHETTAAAAAATALVAPTDETATVESNVITSTGEANAPKAFDVMKADDTRPEVPNESVRTSSEEEKPSEPLREEEGAIATRAPADGNLEVTSELYPGTTAPTITTAFAPATPLKTSTTTNKQSSSSMSSTPALRSDPVISTPIAANHSGATSVAASTLKKRTASKVRANARAWLLEGTKSPAADMSMPVPVSPLVKMRSRN
jgi:Ca2+-binding EF-hand superfamily protein